MKEEKELRVLPRALPIGSDLIEIPFVDLRRKAQPIVHCVLTKNEALELMVSIAQALKDRRF